MSNTTANINYRNYVGQNDYSHPDHNVQVLWVVQYISEQNETTITLPFHSRKGAEEFGQCLDRKYSILRFDLTEIIPSAKKVRRIRKVRKTQSNRLD